MPLHELQIAKVKEHNIYQVHGHIVLAEIT